MQEYACDELILKSASFFQTNKHIAALASANYTVSIHKIIAYDSADHLDFDMPIRNSVNPSSTRKKKKCGPVVVKLASIDNAR